VAVLDFQKGKNKRFSKSISYILTRFKGLPLAHQQRVVAFLGDVIRKSPKRTAATLQAIYDHFYLIASETEATEFFTIREVPNKGVIDGEK
jgi:hypothetical protein